ncbi:MAG: DUF4097 family beta strand repeat-containing protein [Lapillicoccus sp.]
MAQEWHIDGPKVLDIGDEHERVTRLVVALVAGRVDVVTHDDSPTARVEVTEIEGLPLQVRWNGGKLTVTHGTELDKKVLDLIKRTLDTVARNKVVVSISVPVETRTTVSTVSATALVSGVREAVKANTVSGSMTLSDLVGDLDLNTVSGDVECTDIVGPVKVNAVSGTVTIQSGHLPRVKITTVSGDIALDLTSGTSDISSNSVSGDVTVRAPLTGYDVEANTASGQVVVDGHKVGRHGRAQARSGGNGGHSHRYYGHDQGGHLHEGDGALKIKANALSGSIVVLRATPQDGPTPQDRPASQDALPPHALAPHAPAPDAPTQHIPRDPTTPMPSHPQDHPEGWGDDRPAVG